MENTLKIRFPYKPYDITQKWGNVNSAYNQFGFSLHNGVDATVFYDKSQPFWKSETSWPVYCPVEGFKVQLIRNMPQGGGNEIWLISKEKQWMFGTECYAYLVLAHAEKILVPVGYEPKLGELLMIADNTGFSTGPHTHMGLYRVEWDSIKMTYIDTNDANGSFDPSLFFTNTYAVDEASFDTLVTSGLRYYKYKLGL